MSEGWIKLNRQILDHWLWDDKPYSKGQAWIDMLMLANHEDHQDIFRGNIVDRKRGVLYWSMEKLAIRWGWDRRKVSRFLMALEVAGMVVCEVSKRSTTVTIVNYDKFQGNGTSNGTSNSSSDGTSDGTRIKNEKNDKNEKNNIYIPVRHRHGEYRNVLLSAEDFEKLKTQFPDDYQDRIEELSAYMKSTGKTYKDHLATIRNWDRMEKRRQAARPNYSIGDDEQARRVQAFLERHKDEA